MRRHAVKVAFAIFLGLGVAAAGAFASAGRRLSPSGWANPMFVPWLVVARLTRTAPATLAGIRGVANLRWHDGDAWVGPRTIRLEHGVPVHPLGRDLFPVES